MSQVLKNEEYILDSSPHVISKIGSANDTLQQILFAHLFSTIQYSLETSARYFVLPSALTGDTIRAVISAIDFFDAKNRNLNKLIRLLLEIAKISIVSTAIIGSLLAVPAIALIGPLMFIAAVGSNTLYQIGQSIFHGVKWARSKTPLEAQHHRKEFGLNLVGTVVGIGFVAVLALVLAFKPEIGIFALVTTTVASTLFGIGALVSAVNGYVNAKNRAVRDGVENDRTARAENTLTVAPSPTIDSTAKVTATLRRDSAEALLPANTKIKTFHADLIAEMQALPTEDAKKEFVLDLIDSKLDELEGPKRWDLFYRNKQQRKSDALEHLKSLVNGTAVVLGSIVITTMAELLAYEKKTSNSGTVFHSMFRDIGEVQKIFAVANAFLANKPAATIGSDSDIDNDIVFNGTTVSTAKTNGLHGKGNTSVTTYRASFETETAAAAAAKRPSIVPMVSALQRNSITSAPRNTASTTVNADNNEVNNIPTPSKSRTSVTPGG